jgi:hypothetical protein
MGAKFKSKTHLLNTFFVFGDVFARFHHTEVNISHFFFLFPNFYLLIHIVKFFAIFMSTGSTLPDPGEPYQCVKWYLYQRRYRYFDFCSKPAIGEVYCCIGFPGLQLFGGCEVLCTGTTNL